MLVGNGTIKRLGNNSLSLGVVYNLFIGYHNYRQGIYIDVVDEDDNFINTFSYHDILEICRVWDINYLNSEHHVSDDDLLALLKKEIREQKINDILN